MNGSIVRLEGITIENFKNVTYGELDLSVKKKNYKSNLLGLYGQNGSGKTALIDAMNLLKHTLCGVQIPTKFSDYINVNSEFATLTFRFSISQKNVCDIHHIIYSFNLGKVENDVHTNVNEQVNTSVHYKPIIFDEKLSCSTYCNGKMVAPMKPLVDTSAQDVVFGPKTKYNVLLGNKIEKDAATDLIVTKKLAKATSRSFLYSKELFDAIRTYCENDTYKFIIESLVNYGNFSLFVFDTTSNAIISFNALPLSFCIKNNSKGAIGNIVIPFDGNGVIPQDAYAIVENVVDNMNIVLNQLIPGLTIKTKKLGTETLPDGKLGYRIQMLSLKNKKEIALCYESEGIKKIVAILQLLIVVYNNSSITVAIDELDAGVFEYLLGEILRIISEKGKGQLLFTSHNLRPLETLDKCFVAFTTTNPNNRYIRLTNVKATNNLRDFYYRDITLGEQAEEVYESTNNHEIALAFKEAGEFCGS